MNSHINRSAFDLFNMVSKLTPRRAGNAAKVLGSYYLSRVRNKATHSGLPISISIEPTTSCNLRCPECPSGLRNFTRPTGMLDLEVYKKLVDELEHSLLYLLLYFQGEPYLHPHFLDLVQYATAKNIYTATSTNGHYLNEEVARNTVLSGLDRLIISIDGTTQESYEKYRIGGKLDKVINGTKNLVRWKKALKSRTPHLVFQFLVVKPNEHEIEEVFKLAKTLEVDAVGLKTAQIYDYENGSDLIPENTKYSRYKKNGDGKYGIKNRLLNHCWKMWHSSVITWDGKVVPCCFDKDASHVLGDIKKQSFQSIWKEDRYRNFREKILISRKEIDICKNCTEGTKVWT